MAGNEFSKPEVLAETRYGPLRLTVEPAVVQFSSETFTVDKNEPGRGWGVISFDPFTLRLRWILHVWGAATAVRHERRPGADFRRDLELLLHEHRSAVVSALQAAARLELNLGGQSLLPYPHWCPTVLDLAIAVHQEPDEDVRHMMGHLAPDFVGTPEELRNEAVAALT